jgi:hypothetical protein
MDDSSFSGGEIDFDDQSIGELTYLSVDSFYPPILPHPEFPEHSTFSQLPVNYGSASSLPSVSVVDTIEIPSLPSIIPAPTAQDIETKFKSYENRLKRRNELINIIRTAYLRDIISMKHIINKILTENERKEVIQQWEESIPSLDLKQPIELYSPKETEFRFIPCVTCGGNVEIYIRESSRVLALEAAVADYKAREAKWLQANAELTVSLANATRNAGAEKAEHLLEVLFAYILCIKFTFYLQ